MNEATLEGNLHATLDRLFCGPLRPRIEHQTVLAIKVGHQDAPVDGKKHAEIRGRLDVLLRAGDTPVAVLELKRNGLPLTADDETQVWSYARLLHPMPPFYILTNGDETRIFRTYDRSQLDFATIDEHIFAEQLGAAAGAAAADEATAIRFLLGRSPEVFRRLFEAVTRAELDLATGPVADLTRPVAFDFQLPRQATAVLRRRIAEKRAVIALVGPPLSGKTNVVAELCQLSFHGPAMTRGAVPLYVNCGQRVQGIFQSLASGLTKQTGVPATAEDVRHWLTSGFITTDEERPVIILDAWPSRERDRWEGELAELLDLANETTFTLLIVLDESQADTLLIDPHRGQQTRLGTMAQRIWVAPLLSHQELLLADHALTDHNDLTLETGAEHNIFYRHPYTWRFLACAPRQSGMVPSILGVGFIHTARQVVNPSARHWDALRRFADAVVDEELAGPVNDILLASPGWVTLETAERIVSSQGVALLQEAGFVWMRNGPEDRALLSAQIPPLLASAAAHVLADRLRAAIGRGSVVDAVDGLLRNCWRFPYSAVVGAAAVRSVDETQATEELLAELLSREPTINKMPVGFRGGVLVEGLGMVEITPDILMQTAEDGGGQLFGDVLPYLILSFLATEIDTTTTPGRQVFEQIVNRVASVGVPMVPIESRNRELLRCVLPIRQHDLPNGGTLVSNANGIIEPITHALRHTALVSPDAFDAYIQSLLQWKDASLPLVYRTWTAAASVAHPGSPVAEKAERWTAALSDKVKAVLKAEIRPTSN